MAVLCSDFIIHLACVNRPKEVDEYYKYNLGLTEKIVNYLKDNNAVAILEEIKEEKKDKFKKEESKKLNNKKVAKK